MSPQPDPAEIDSLMGRIRGGDEAALGDFLQRYESRLRMAARVLLGPALRTHLDSLDLVQSVNCVMLPGLRDGKFDVSSPERLLGLALTILRRKVANKWRHLQRQKPADSQSEEELLVTNSPGDDPAMSALVKDSVEHVLNSLPDNDRQLIELRLLGYSTPEIAQQMQCDPHLLRARLSRLRQRLQDHGIAEQL